MKFSLMMMMIRSIKFIRFRNPYKLSEFISLYKTGATIKEEKYKAVNDNHPFSIGGIVSSEQLCYKGVVKVEGWKERTQIPLATELFKYFL